MGFKGAYWPKTPQVYARPYFQLHKLVKNLYRCEL